MADALVLNVVLALRIALRRGLVFPGIFLFSLHRRGKAGGMVRHPVTELAESGTRKESAFYEPHLTSGVGTSAPVGFVGFLPSGTHLAGFFDVFGFLPSEPCIFDVFDV